MKVEVNYPDFPKDTVFDLGGIAVKNGASVTLTADDEERIKAFHGKPVKDVLQGDHVKVSGAKEGGDE